MGLREIINRITKIENGLGSDEMVTLIVLENGVEYKRYVPIVDAMLMVLKQDMEVECGENRIVGIEDGDEDGFIQAILEGGPLNPEEMKRIVETESEEDKRIMAEYEEKESDIKEKTKHKKRCIRTGLTT